jgi:hypothetical protein
MSVIYVNTDNTNIKDKVYNGTLAKGDAAAAEKKMQEVVVKVIAKNPGFTTNKMPNPKGYSIRLKIAKLESTANQTKCTIAGELLRYPNTYSAKGSGQAMVSTSFSGSATATGMGKYAIVDCVEAVAESMVEKAIPAMRSDITRW